MHWMLCTADRLVEEIKVTQFVRRLRALPCMDMADFIIAVENNESHTHASALTAIAMRAAGQPSSVLFQNDHDIQRPGFWTDETYKERIQSVTNKFLDADRIYFTENMICECVDDGPANYTTTTRPI